MSMKRVKNVPQITAAEVASPSGGSPGGVRQGRRAQAGHGGLLWANVHCVHNVVLDLSVEKHSQACCNSQETFAL